MGRWMALALAGAAGFAAAVALTPPARGDLVPTLPVSVSLPISLPTVTTPPPVPPAPQLPPPPPLPPLDIPAAPATAAPPAEQRAERSGGHARPARHGSAKSQPARSGAVIGIRRRKAGMIELVVRKSCSVLGRRQLRGHPGINRVRFVGRVHGHRLRPGTYTVGVMVIRAGKRSRVARFGVRVGATRAERTAVPAQSCGQASVT